jgi:hypothetical protein
MLLLGAAPTLRGQGFGQRSGLSASLSYSEVGIRVTQADSTLQRGRFWVSLPLATLFGAVAFVAGGIGGYAAFKCHGEGNQYCAGSSDNADYLSGLVISTFGTTLGAHLGGVRRESQGKWLPTLAAAAAPIVVHMVMLDGSRRDTSGQGLVILSPILAALVDYQIRKPR